MYSKYDEAQFHLRMSHELHAKIKQRAKANGRSINTEIVRTLEQSLERNVLPNEDEDERLATILSDRFREVAVEVIKKEKTRQ